MLYKRYTAYYDPADGTLITIIFELPESATPDQIVVIAAGLLFRIDCCPGEDFCVIDAEDNVIEPTEPHVYYNYSPVFGERWRHTRRFTVDRALARMWSVDNDD